ncbi:universal stress protein [Streptomyces sp. NPDC059224]|uniref:universal stress protein n=1 Tax=Streptomyces sp. NPDC059224 TaxID=3346775 RepID=UPI0036A13DC4
MYRTVTVGLDGSPESRAAAEWAAREARLRGLPLRIVHVAERAPVPVAQAPLVGPETSQHWIRPVPREAAEGLRVRHPGLDVLTEELTGPVPEALCAAADSAELLALGSRGFGGVGGFVVGSVSLAVVARAERPVVLVRDGEQAADEHGMDPAGVPSAATPFRPVVLGLDVDHPDDTLLEFAFDAAVRRETPLRVVSAWPETTASYYRFPGDAELKDDLERSHRTALAEALRPWRQKFPGVDVIEASRCGSAAQVVVGAARDASLAVVGRRSRTGFLGAHIGHVTHAALHHIAAPVAVVAHD